MRERERQTDRERKKETERDRQSKREGEKEGGGEGGTRKERHWCIYTILCKLKVTMLFSSPLREDDTEYWFGEIYIPIAMILPYSKQIVHQDGEDSPLQLLEGFDREITMPVEPRV